MKGSTENSVLQRKFPTVVDGETPPRSRLGLSLPVVVAPPCRMTEKLLNFHGSGH